VPNGTEHSGSEEARKNLKKPESPEITILSHTLEIVADPPVFQAEKKVGRKPENAARAVGRCRARELIRAEDAAAFGERSRHGLL
jgi:hypothetical protein